MREWEPGRDRDRKRDKMRRSDRERERIVIHKYYIYQQ